MKRLIILLLSMSITLSFAQSWSECGATPGTLSGTHSAIELNQPTAMPTFTIQPGGVSSIPNTGYLIVKSDSLAIDGLGNTIIGTSEDGIVTPQSLGLEVGDTFAIVPFSYNRLTIKKVTDGILNGFTLTLGSCCSVVDQAAPTSGTCNALNAVGIADSSDVNTLQDVISVLSVYSNGMLESTSLAGLKNDIDSLNIDMNLLNITSCSGQETVFCYAFDGTASNHDYYVVECGIDTSVVLNGTTLLASNSGAFYQWLDCNDGFAPIVGETNQSFIPGINGTYAVEITNSECVDTSNCITVNSLELDEFHSLPALFYPNPTSGVISVDATIPVSRIELFDITGKRVAHSESNQVDLAALEAGTYVVKIYHNNSVSLRQIIKE